MKANKYTQELFDEGFNDDTIRAVYLIPVVDTAWADGKIQPNERSEILSLLKEREIQNDSEAYKLIESWLARKPADDFFVHAHSLIEPLFKELKENRGGDMSWVIKAVERVAKATGNPRDPISPGERKVIRSISERLNSIVVKPNGQDSSEN